MLLIRLKLENFRQHQQTQIDFLPGMTAIVGANGTGKSTILEGITFALYGEQRETRDTIRFYWSDPSKKKFSSELTFQLDDKRYVITRSNADASLMDTTKGQSVILASGLTDTRRACEKLLGLNYDQFINSFCAEQKNLGFLNFKTSAARQEEVARMLGFDRLKMAEDMARERKSILKSRADTLEKTLGSLIELEAAHKEANAKLKEVQGQVATMEKQTKALQEKMPAALELRTKAEKWRELNQEIKQIRGQADGLKEASKLAQTALDQAKKNLLELQALEPLEQEYRRLETESKEWDRRREEDHKREMLAEQAKSLRCEIVEFDLQLKQLRLEDISALEKAFLGSTEKLSRSESSTQEKLTEWNRTSAKAQELLAAASARVDEAKHALDHCQEMVAKGICPECGLPLKEGYTPKLEKARTDFADRTAAFQKAQKEGSKSSTKPAALKKAETELIELKTAMEAARKARDVAALQHAQARTLQTERTKKAELAAKMEASLANTPAVYDAKKHQATKNKLVAMDPEHLRFLVLKSGAASIEDREKDHKKATKDLEAAKTRFRTLETERNALKFETEEDVDSAIAAHRALDIELRDIQSCFKSTQTLKQFAEAAAVQSKARIKEHQDRAKELSEAKNAAAAYEVLARELRALRERLNRSIRPDLEARASENLNLLTNGRYSTLTLSDNFEAQVIEDGTPKPVISGGEEDVVALSLRLALSELIQERNGRPMSLFVLDEVFGSLDAERRQSVLDRLASLKGRFNQVLVISHIEEINQVADQALYLSRNADTRSTLVTDAPPDAAALLL
jgi:exonuclease SbcC